MKTSETSLNSLLDCPVTCRREMFSSSNSLLCSRLSCGVCVRVCVPAGVWVCECLYTQVRMCYASGLYQIMSVTVSVYKTTDYRAVGVPIVRRNE